MTNTDGIGMRLATNTIVILDTTDIVFGKLRVPAIIRYYDEINDAYEVNVLTPTNGSCATMSDLHWWTVRRHEIAEVIGMARTAKKNPVPPVI